jgi:hypothetical protein
MSYGDDVLEGLPFVLSNPSGATYTAPSYVYSGYPLPTLPLFSLFFFSLRNESAKKHILKARYN